MGKAKVRYVNADNFTISYFIDEHALFRELGVAVGFPLRVFDLRGLWIDEEKFLRDLAPTFQSLPWDEYDVQREKLFYLSSCYPEKTARLKKYLEGYYSVNKKADSMSRLVSTLPRLQKQGFEKIQPYRKRAIARFIVEKEEKERWRIERIPSGGFSQNVANGDYRKHTRIFREMAEDVTQHQEFLKLLARLGMIVESIHKKPERLSIVAHQVSVAARHGRFGSNSPEGVHQDGVDYIVSALVVERKGIGGGTSHVYGFDKKQLYLDITLNMGEGIFQTDRGSPFWHDVTPIYIDPASKIDLGERNIFGFDITVE